MLLPLLHTALFWPDKASSLASSSAAATDVLQHATRYELHIDLPGADPGSMKLELNSESAADNYLQISNVVKVFSWKPACHASQPKSHGYLDTWW